MALTAFYPPFVAPRSVVARPTVRAFPKTQPLSSPRTHLIRGLLTCLCADPRTVYHRGKAGQKNALPREARFWLSFDTAVQYQLHFPLPTSTCTPVDLYIEIARLWPKIKTWNMKPATVDGLATDITALLLEFAEGHALAIEESAQKAARYALPSPVNMGVMAYYDLLGYSDNRSASRLELEWEIRELEDRQVS